MSDKRSWSVGELQTAAKMNEHVREMLKITPKKRKPKGKK